MSFLNNVESSFQNTLANGLVSMALQQHAPTPAPAPAPAPVYHVVAAPQPAAMQPSQPTQVVPAILTKNQATATFVELMAAYDAYIASS